MRKVGILVLAFALVIGMSFGVMAEDGFKADVEQKGDNNKLEAFQNGDISKTNEIVVFQDGDSNESFINQSSLSKTDVIQIGDNNYADVEVGFNQWTAIEQDGNRNNATVTTSMGHSAWDTQRENKHGTHLSQQGNDNSFTANIFISNSYSKQMGDENVIVLNQNGMFDGSYITQEGNFNYSDISQNGNDKAFVLQRNEGIGNKGNILRLKQSGGSEFTSEGIETNHFLYQKSTSTFAQLGDGNRLAGVSKSGDSVVLNSYEAAEQNSSIFNGYQDGNNNVIGLYQGGNDDGLVTQDGNRNEALLYQNETGNHDANIVQNGDDNSAQVVQIGN